MIPLTQADIEKLLECPESETLDFKRDQYALQKGGVFARAELIKDILAFANTGSSKEAVILIGVEETAARPVVVGVTSHLQDADIQQLVNEKTNRPVHFHYERVDYLGKSVGAIRIDRIQNRPLYLRADFDKLIRANMVYARRGSSTAIVSPDEILQMNRLPVSALGGRNGHPGVRQLAERWLDVFDHHGVKRSQIALVLKRQDLMPAHFQSAENVLQFLSDDLIEEICQLFHVHREWLEGGAVPLQHVYIGGQLESAVDIMVDVRRRSRETTLIGIKSRKNELLKYPRQSVGALIRTEVAIINNESVYSYLPFATGPWFDWSNLKYRRYMKQIFMAARWLGMNFEGWTFSTRDIGRLSGGEVFPMSLKQVGCARWYPDDYVHGPTESVAAKDIDDYRELMAYSQQIGFLERVRKARAMIPGLQGLDPESPLAGVVDPYSN